MTLDKDTPDTQETTAPALKGYLAGKTGVIFGVAHKSSIAWGIAKALSDAGMRLAFTYQGERLEKNVRQLADTLENSMVLPCDVTKDEELDAVFHAVEAEFGKLDTLVHSVAFAKREDLTGGFSATSRDGFKLALDISAYSLVPMANAAKELMTDGGSIITMTYLGGVKVIPNYNVMGIAKSALEMNVRYLASELGESGIRVNGISAGPIRTLASSAVGGILDMIHHVEAVAPLKRTVTQTEVGNTAAFLCSDLSSGITGQIIYCDAGYEIMGMTGTK
ncbi:MAG: enoyl-ACP reductase FabI [Vampirovibrio sp.]|nr:enoyl-ACP reductase FabI [Vampirovibrio sp.]